MNQKEKIHNPLKHKVGERVGLNGNRQNIRLFYNHSLTSPSKAGRWSGG